MAKKLAILIITIFLPLFLFAFPQAAKAASAELFLVSTSSSYNRGENFEVEIRLNSGGEKVIGVKSYLNFSQYLSLPDLKADVSDSDFGTIVINQTQGNQLQIEAIDVDGVNGSNLLIAKIPFLAMVSGRANVSFDSSSQVSDENGNNILSQTKEATYIITSTGNSILALNPSQGTFIKGESFVLKVLLDTGGQKSDGVDLHYLNFNPDLLQVKRVVGGGLYPNTEINKYDNNQGRIEFSQLSQPGQTFTGSGVLAEIVFEAVATGTANVWFDFEPGSSQDCNVSKACSEPQDILSSVANGQYQIKEPTERKKGIRLKIQPEGVIIIKDFVVDIEVLDSDTGALVFEDSSGTVDENGYYKFIDLTPYQQNDWRVKVKAPYYLSKAKEVQLNQEELETGVEMRLLAGNLQDSDNVINELDWSIMSSKWFSSEPIADINKDGIVNSLDWHYLNKNWGSGENQEEEN